MSDGTSPGIGAFAGHFHDSNVDNPNDLTGLKEALNEIVTFNFLGVTIVGPNICTKGNISSEIQFSYPNFRKIVYLRLLPHICFNHI